MNINKNILYICKAKGILPDTLGSILFVLECMYYEKFDLLDKFDDSKTNKNAFIIYKECEKLQLLKKQVSETHNVHYTLSFDGKNFLERLLEVSVDDVIIQTSSEKLSDWITDWIDLWKDEKGVFYRDKSNSKNPRVLRISEKDAFERMGSFLTKYGYIFKDISPKEIIMGATKKYINEYKKVNFVFCTGPHNFIHVKRDSTVRSILAELCESYNDEPEEAPRKGFGFSVNE